MSKKKYELITIKRGGYELDTMRNMLVEDALKNKADYLLFLDTDMNFPINIIPRMITVFEANKTCDAVTGIYTWKKPPYLPQLFGKFDKKNMEYQLLYRFPLNRPFWVNAAGMGFMMVKKEVFLKNKKPWFKFVEKGEIKEIAKGLGEDLYFAWKCKPKMLCDPSLNAGHYDTRSVNLENYINKNGLEVKNNQIEITKEQLEKIDKEHQENIKNR